jgi:hypothetical protein
MKRLERPQMEQEPRAEVQPITPETVEQLGALSVEQVASDEASMQPQTVARPKPHYRPRRIRLQGYLYEV